MTENISLVDAKAALKSFFGYDAFRPMQDEIIESMYAGKDTVVLMPTGGGKSICYQIPAVTLPGLCIVVSPLIALMKDQVEGIKANGIPAAFYNSTQSYQEQHAIEELAIAGNLKILYVSPEKIVSQNFQPFLRRLKISLVAIDEAHCISQWGHDFRPEYTQLRFLKQVFPQTPVMALTATADKLTRKDILNNLGMQDPKVFISSFDRPNISLTVEPGLKRIQKIVAFLEKRKGQSGIIYCLARKSCETLAEKLREAGFNAKHYHAQLPPAERSKVQEDFINDRVPIIVATIAFGMGIDKSNVRFVIHYNLPRNVEGYYQEIGRAGRDGLPSDAVLFYSYADVSNYRDMIADNEGDDESKNLKLAKLQRMYDYAETQLCRRKTILAYFGEELVDSCGNCDVCKNPPRYFDGTVACQKALSAALRMQEQVGMNMLIDVLRGSNRREIMEKGYNNIKTYGAGRDLSADDWRFLIGQMIHLGYFEVAYDEGHVLKVGNQGKALLFEGKQAKLVMPVVATPEIKKEAKQQKMPVSVDKAAKDSVQEELFEHLRAFRRKIAQENGTPPYLIFSDATLQDMAKYMPFTPKLIRNISGVGDKKMETYAPEFLKEIQNFLGEKLMTVPGFKFIGHSDFLSYYMYTQGQTIEEIAATRNRNPSTIFTHIANMYFEGLPLDIAELVSPAEVDMVQGALGYFEGPPYTIAPIFEHFEEKISHDRIRLALRLIAPSSNDELSMDNNQ